MARTFRRRRDGRITVRLRADEVALLRIVARDVLLIIAAPPEGDVGARLYPRAYLDPTEEDAENEFRALVHHDLAEQRHAALAMLLDKLPAVDPDAAIQAGDEAGADFDLTADEALQWLTAVNDARLVLGTALGITEDDDGDFAPDDPRYDLGTCYHWLTFRQTELVEVLLDGIGEAGTDDD